jgi:hypothetical protein
MNDYSPECKAARRAHADRATARAKVALKPGDWLQYTMCAGLRGRAKFTGWDGIWACSRTKSDIHALHIFKVNGQLTSFRDDGLDPRSPEAL